MNNLLKGLLHTVIGSWASIQDLITLLDKRFPISNDRDELYDQIEILISESASPNSHKIGQKQAFQILLARELQQTKSNINLIPDDLEEQLRSHFQVYKDILADEGFDLKNAQMQIVEKFPHPYEEMEFTAMSFDTGDFKQFGIIPGVALRKHQVAPFISSATLAHELIHSCFGKVDSPRLARGFEEGICDLLGYFLLASKVLDPSICASILINRRFANPTNQRSAIYCENLQQAVWYYHLTGLGGLLDLLKDSWEKGREVVKKAEKRLLEGDLENLRDSRRIFEQMDQRLIYRNLIFPRNLVVSPLALYLAEKIHVGDTIGKIIKDNGVEEREGLSALKELQERVYVILLDDNKVVSDETKELLATGTLRYEVPKDADSSFG